ncbi:heterokaryon incompatibility protein-domain-containing protein [Camillea tinctor]|nr:heterokaryon incompatibility protein-domain-containing protein [Camillea tinctor]
MLLMRKNGIKWDVLGKESVGQRGVRVIKRKREGLVNVSRSCPERSYVELHVPTDIHSVNRVVFRLLSHDQGFGDSAHRHGGKDSFTWFVATALTPGGHNRAPKRVLQRNVHAKARFTRHKICWCADSQDQSIREWVSSIRGGDSIQVIPKAQWPAWINFVQEVEIEVLGNEEHTADIVAGNTTPSVSRSLMTGSSVAHEPGCYRPLDQSSQEIRLLVLDKGQADESLFCSLIYAVLSQHLSIEYEALSYCWGDPREKGTITVRVPEQEGTREYTLSITSALHAALKRLRSPAEERILWIDAIRINQDDLSERASQVALMRDIYTKASSVAIWLGDGNEATRRTIRTVEAIRERFEMGGDSLNSTRAVDLKYKDDIHHPLIERHSATHNFLSEWPLFELPWLRRTWVIQEVFNARSVRVLCGTDVLSWPTILRVNRCIGMHDMMANLAYKVFMPPIFATILDSKGREDVLIKGLDLDATDSRDKIFAMLQLPKDIVVDYTRSVEEVFTRFTKWWIHEHKSLKILSAVQALEGRTWQETTYDRDATTVGYSNWAIGILGLATSDIYSAGGDSIPDTDLLTASPWRELCVTGLQVGRIASITRYPYFRGPGKHEALHRAYVALFDPLNITGKWSHQLGSNHTNTYIMDDDVSLMRGHFDSHYEPANPNASLDCHSPCFLTTEGGTKGLCPFAARPGDILAVLYGGTVPFVLRERCQGGSMNKEGVVVWECVGECYLDGYMQGRAMEEQGEKGRVAQKFILV